MIVYGPHNYRKKYIIISHFYFFTILDQPLAYFPACILPGFNIDQLMTHMCELYVVNILYKCSCIRIYTSKKCWTNSMGQVLDSSRKAIKEKKHRRKREREREKKEGRKDKWREIHNTTDVREEILRKHIETKEIEM